MTEEIATADAEADQISVENIKYIRHGFRTATNW
jgi:hypothetical protein